MVKHWRALQGLSIAFAVAAVRANRKVSQPRENICRAKRLSMENQLQHTSISKSKRQIVSSEQTGAASRCHPERCRVAVRGTGAEARLGARVYGGQEATLLFAGGGSKSPMPPQYRL